METHKVELGGMTLHGYADMPDPFAGLAVTGVNGWRGLSGSRGSSDAIPGAHGAYASSRVLREPRSIEVRGAAIAATEAEALAMLDDLEAEVGSRLVEMWVSDAQGRWRRSVEVEAIQITGAYNRSRVQFSIDAIAPDPRRYQAVQTAGPITAPVRTGGLILPKAFPWNFGTDIVQTIELENTGRIEMFPVVRVEGGASAITIFAGPNRVMFGEFEGVLLIDSKQRRAFLNGRDVTQWLLRRDWPSVAALSSEVFYFSATDSSADLIMTVDYEIGAM